ncbi:MAG: type II toxin-antitoxin system prevent-host-death family antitoxin [Gemmataceae bacterium]
MDTIGAYEAKSRLSHLLDRVEHGESITITKHGRPIARLVPADDLPRRPADEAVAGFARLRARVKPGPSVRQLIEAGRRF